MKIEVSVTYDIFLMCRAAMKRGISVFLPTATYPMFPEKLAMEGMSLKQGEICRAVTVSVVLHSDGRYKISLLVHLSTPHSSFF